MSDMEPKEPGKSHIRFAQEVVALARAHGMDSLTFSFRSNFTLRHDRDEFGGVVSCSWSEGRHGDRSRIGIRFEGSTGVDELPREVLP